MIRSSARVLASVLLFSAVLSAQENKPAKVFTPYKLTFVVSELQDGKKINQRTYSMILVSNTDRKSVIKSGSRVPVVSGGFVGSADGKPINQFQYLDVGVNIEAWISSESDADWLKLDGDVDISSIAASEQIGGASQPIIRQNRQELHAMIRPEKPTLLAALDDVNSTHTTQIEVTATRVK